MIMPEAKNSDLFTIGALAQEFGLTLRTIRFYEGVGLIHPTRSGQNRLYSHQDHARLQLICRGKRLGFSIAEIKEFLNLYDAGSCQKEQMRFLLDRVRIRIEALKIQLQDVTKTLHELQKIEGEINSHLTKTDCKGTDFL